MLFVFVVLYQVPGIKYLFLSISVTVLQPFACGALDGSVLFRVVPYGILCCTNNILPKYNLVH
jgi:hypothetical protein